MSKQTGQVYRPMLEAVAFAARAHRGQLRKDRETPYVSHVFRVCFIVRDLFKIVDHRVLIAALLHDTLEDTLVDFDGLAEAFGPQIAQWVALLSKDKRQRETERELAYVDQLANAPWQVQVCKLADIFDNLMDLANLPPERQKQYLHRAKQFLAGFAPKTPRVLRRPLRLVQKLLLEMEGNSLGHS